MFYQFNLRKQKVTFAVKLIDYYTGNNLIETVKVSIEDSCIQPIIKQDSMYVFTGLERHHFKVIIQCQKYISKEIIIDDKDEIWLSVYPIKNIFLLPGKKYELLPFTTFISCRIKPFTYVYGIPMDKTSSLTLAFYKEMNIQFYSLYPMSYVNHSFAFYENSCLETFTIVSQNENACVMDKKLKNDYPQGTKVYPLSIGQADESGDLLLLLWGFMEANKEMLLNYEDKNETVMIQYGRGNTL